MDLAIKICGMREYSNILSAADLKPDIFGFIFYKGSLRFAGDNLNPADLTSELVGIKKTGVFVNSGFDEIMQHVERYSLDMVQLHGDESPELCHKIRESGPGVIKVFRIEPENPVLQTDRYTGCTDYYLFDTGSEKFGGTGRKFNWELLDDYDTAKPFFLSGGIGPDDAGMIASVRNPYFHGIDLNSRFEISPGLKDIGRLKKFIEIIRDK